MKVEVSRRRFVLGSAATALGLSVAGTFGRGPAHAQSLPTVVDPRFTAPVIDPLAIPKFVAPLPQPGVNGWEIIASPSPNLKVVETEVEIVGGYETRVWAYRGAGSYIDTFLGPTIIAQRGTPTTTLIEVPDQGQVRVALPHPRARGQRDDAATSSDLTRREPMTCAARPETKLLKI
jgi:hypothetical protein